MVDEVIYPLCTCYGLMEQADSLKERWKEGRLELQIKYNKLRCGHRRKHRQRRRVGHFSPTVRDVCPPSHARS